MFNVSGKCFITNMNEVSPKLITATAYTFKRVVDPKSKQETFEPTFIRCKIIGNALVNVITLGIMDKDCIMIDSGVINSVKWYDKKQQEHTQLELTIFELSEYVKEELAGDKDNDNGKRPSRVVNKKGKNNSRFKRETTPIDDGDMPF